MTDPTEIAVEEENMASFVGEVLGSDAVSRQASDFVLSLDGNRLAYVDVEGCSVWLITCEKAKLVPVSTEGKP